LVGAVATVLGVACGEGGGGPEPPPPTPNRQPEVLGEVPAQTMLPGETLTIDVSGIFSDPDGDALTITATGGEDVVALSVAGTSVVVRVADGVEVIGTVVVPLTITASDPDGLSASVGAAVSIFQPNRGPTVVGAIPDTSLEAGTAFETDAGALFSDPDRDPLTFEAESDTEFVEAEVTDGKITVRGAGPGSAVVTVTATDPHGEMASLSAEVSVFASVIIDRDFSSTDGWTFIDAEGTVEDGVMQLTKTDAESWALAASTSVGSWTDWEITAVMGRAEEEGVFPAIAVAPGALLTSGYAFGIGSGWEEDGVTEPHNYMTFYVTVSLFEITLQRIPAASGHSDLIQSAPGELTEVRFSIKDATMRAHIGDTELFAWPVPPSYPRTIGGLSLVTYSDQAGVSTLWDHISGEGVRAGAADREYPDQGPRERSRPDPGR